MNWPTRASKANQLEAALKQFSKATHPLLGIATPARLRTLVMQMIASLRRLDYTRHIKSRDITSDRLDPSSDLFDPERGATLLARQGNVNEAIWLIFLATHFGQNGKHGWRMLRDVYSGLGTGTWSWARASANQHSFEAWLRQAVGQIRGAFGNHRKYETLNPNSTQGTASVIESFVTCFAPSPEEWFRKLVKEVGNDPHALFDAAYQRLVIARFGRLAKFDFLALLGRLDLAPIEPGSAYLKGATGPLRGARLLINGDVKDKANAEELDRILIDLDAALGVGMQVMEDSICNWQKSPEHFVHFKG